MKFLAVFTPLIALATTTNGGPIKRAQEVEVTFIGAANAQFSQSFPADGSIITISNPLSISHISSNTAGVQCAFNGVDHSVTDVNGAETVDVGPPQTQISGTCQAQVPMPPTPPSPPTPVGSQVQVTFIGAANAQFSQSFPVDGSIITITNPLNISHISSNTAGVQCAFNGIDHSVTDVNGAETVDVGPPQTQISGSCQALGSGPNPPTPPIQPQPVGGQVQVIFLGAANAQFAQSFPTNGEAMQITNPLSISHIELDTQGVKCVFEGIDHSVTTVNGAQLVDVGPPQTQLSGSCMAM